MFETRHHHKPVYNNVNIMELKIQAFHRIVLVYLVHSYNHLNGSKCMPIINKCTYRSAVYSYGPRVDKKGPT